MESQHATKYISWHPADAVRPPRSADLDISVLRDRIRSLPP